MEDTTQHAIATAFLNGMANGFVIAYALNGKSENNERLKAVKALKSYFGSNVGLRECKDALELAIENNNARTS